LKTKDRVGKLGNEAGMSMKINGLPFKPGNVVEKKGCYKIAGEARIPSLPLHSTPSQPVSLDI
jgi:hypothetical protein